jgi:XTP/dITP diphosphohydrolase
MSRRVLVATHNRGKVRELSDMLGDLDLDWLSLDDAGITHEVEETGRTFEENAVLKAMAYAAAGGLLTLADDSGLEVDALGGRPGVLTARYGGPGLTFPERWQLLLDELQDVPWERRTARFRCTLALAGPQGLITTSSGVCDGVIAWEPAGSGGFGYDPIFFLPEWGTTMAGLDAANKHRISHRGRAIAGMAGELRSLLRSEEQNSG